MERMSAVRLANQIRQGERTPIEIVAECLRRIREHNPDLNAIVTLNEQAEEEALEKTAMLARGEKLGPLHGIPILLKDLTPTKGLRTTFGSRLFADHIPDRDATIVTRLKEAGAIVLGKTNTPDFGHKGTTDNTLFGSTKNPWDKSKTSGGSSGGAASAVASGMVPLAEGSDGGGSIRIPASFCGVYGFKPTYGRIPMDNSLDNVFGSNNPFVNHGSLSQTVADAALFVDVTQGAAPTDPFSLPIFDAPLHKQLNGSLGKIKIAYTKDFGMYEVDPDVLSVIDAQVAKWRSLGCQVDEVSMDFDMTLHEFLGFFKNMWYAAAAKGGREVLEKAPDMISPSYQMMIKQGFGITAQDYLGYQEKRSAVWHVVQHYLQDYDLIMSPTLAIPAFDYQLLGPESINGKKIIADSDWMMTHIYNMTGLPAASIPAGFTKAGLPVGMQIAGNRFNDGLVLRASQAYETFVGGFSPPSLIQ